MFAQKIRIHLGVVDANRSARFYEALFGAAPSVRGANMAIFELESPALSLTLEGRARAGKAGRPNGDNVSRELDGRGPGADAREPFALLLNEPRDIGTAAVALRRVGVPLRLEDQGIEARDPDGNAWQVRFVPSTRVRAVVIPGGPR